MTDQKHHDEHPHVVSRNARNGLILFAFYVALYAGFIFLAVFRTEWFGTTEFGGVNLAIIYGFVLIAAALVLALVYVILCRPSAARQQRAEGGRG